MKAVLVDAPGHLVVADSADPEPCGGALVAVESGGLCGTDLKILSGRIPVRYPRILGHEVVGTVVSPGPQSLVPAGTRVLVDPLIPCGRCWACRNGRTHLCLEGGLMGRDIDGGFTEYLVADEQRLHPIPEGLDPREASMLQVLGTCIHAQLGCEVFPGEVAAVVGLGVAGLLHLELLLARGVRDVVAISRSDWKRERARALGALATASPETASEVVGQVSQGRGVDLVIEAAGTVAALRQAIHLCGHGATLISFGVITETTAEGFPFFDLYYKELKLQGSRAARGADYDRAIRLVESERLELGPLLTHSFPLDEAAQAFALAGHPGSNALKVTLEMRRTA